ncbi:single-stranded DNA-binding protein [Neolewinella aurantiaca]|uniref:Single-stranded DNA-binding protein n=1 Tax=Neolewinella aurantiaca TaxID=2602767 RepID=A0A5C7FHJ1_9BACT|nr:single-stranded DNA-binding protein [Neolewinella aurantiaca]
MNTSNFINLIGRLGDAPKTTTLPSGIVVAEFSLATNEYYRDRNGNKQTRTDWHRVKAFGKLAELFDQYLDRGKQVSIVGSMRYRKWVDKHDQNRTSAEVIAQSFSFLGGGDRQLGDQEMSSTMVADPAPAAIDNKTQRRRERTAVSLDETVLETVNDDLPF